MTSVQYTYDVSGNLVRTDTTVTTGGVTAPTTTQLFVVDSNNPTGYSQVLETLNVSGEVENTFIVGASVLGQVSAGSGLSVFQTDILGSTRVVTNSQGLVTAQYNYDPYGNAVGFNPATAATNILYTGAAYNAQLKSYNLRSRNYDPSTGRFDRMDSYGGDQTSPLTLNRYIYGNDDPIDNVDPSGKFAFGIDIAIDSALSAQFVAAAGVPAQFAAALTINTLLNPFQPLITAILYQAPLAISLYNLGNSLSQLASTLSGQLIGGILDLYSDVNDPPLTYNGKQLVLDQGQEAFVQKAVLTGQQFLVTGLTQTIQAAEQFQKIADQVKATARQQAAAIQNSIPSIINSIALQFAYAFLPGGAAAPGRDGCAFVAAKDRPARRGRRARDSSPADDRANIQLLLHGQFTQDQSASAADHVTVERAARSSQDDRAIHPGRLRSAGRYRCRYRNRIRARHGRFSSDESEPEPARDDDLELHQHQSRPLSAVGIARGDDRNLGPRAPP